MTKSADDRMNFLPSVIPPFAKYFLSWCTSLLASDWKGSGLLLGSGKPLLGSGKPFLGSGKSLLGSGKPLLGSGKPLLGSGKPLLGSGKPLLGSSNPLLNNGSRSTLGMNSGPLYTTQAIMVTRELIYSQGLLPDSKSSLSVVRFAQTVIESPV